VTRQQRGPKVCGRLLVPDEYSKFQGQSRADACGLETGHDESLEPTPHKGRWTGAIWETFVTPEGKKGRNIIHYGQGEGEQLVGGVAGLQRHGPGGHVTPPAAPASHPTP